jgi:hypothetical protein
MPMHSGPGERLRGDERQRPHVVRQKRPQNLAGRRQPRNRLRHLGGELGEIVRLRIGHEVQEPDLAHEALREQGRRLVAPQLQDAHVAATALAASLALHVKPMKEGRRLARAAGTLDGEDAGAAR